MSGILSYFGDWKVNTMAIQEKTTTKVDGKKASEVWNDIVGLEAVPCWFFYKNQGIAFISDRMKDSATAVIIVDPGDVDPSLLKDTQRGVIGGVPYYFLDPDNVLNLGEVITIPVNEEDK